MVTAVLLSCVQLFCLFPAAELGIDSHEIREIFLAKIYELSNPCSSGERMEDDFLRKLVHTVRLIVPLPIPSPPQKGNGIVHYANSSMMCSYMKGGGGARFYQGGGVPPK